MNLILLQSNAAKSEHIFKLIQVNPFFLFADPKNYRNRDSKPRNPDMFKILSFVVRLTLTLSNSLFCPSSHNSSSSFLCHEDRSNAPFI